MDIAKVKTIEGVVQYHMENIDSKICLKLHESREILSLHYLNFESNQPHYFDALVFIKCIRGTMRITVKETSFRLHPGDIILIPYMTLHEITAEGQVQTLTLLISGRFIVQNIPWFPYINHAYCFQDTHLDYLITMIDSLINQFDRTDRFGFKSYLNMFFYETYKLIEDKEAKNIPLWEGHFPKQFAEILLYVHKNYTRPITLSDLSLRFHLSTHHISRLFKQYMNQTFKSYLDYLRVEHACFLLKNTQDPIIKILYDAGFPNKQSFIRIFKEFYHMLPSEYRSFKS